MNERAATLAAFTGCHASVDAPGAGTTPWDEREAGCPGYTATTTSTGYTA
jgi:hypothetical protein